MAVKEMTVACVSSRNIPSNRAALWEQVVIHFSGVSGRTPDDVRREISQLGGDVLITDKEAKAIFARLEQEYNHEGMFNPTDLRSSNPSGETAAPSSRTACADPAEDTSVSGLVDIIAGKLGL